VLRPGISLIALTQEDGGQVYGTIAYDPTNDQFLLFTIISESIPPNTLPAVTAVINPQSSGPGYGLPAAVAGQRYLLTEPVGASPAWLGTFGQAVIANPNDIIEYDGTQWVVSFNSQDANSSTQFVTNMTTEIQYKWIGHAWVKSYQGLYPGGKWSIII